MIARAWWAIAVALATAACASPVLKLPTGSGAPAADAIMALDQALATCTGVKSFTAELAMTGQTGGQKVRGRLAVGLSAPASVYLEAPAPFGAPVFVFAAENDDATLWLPRDRRVLEHGRPADVLDAVAGVPLGTADLRDALTGCAPRPSGAGARQMGDRWRLIPGDADLYLHRGDRPDGPWQLVAVTHRPAGGVGEWRVEYGSFLSGLPRLIRLTSADRQRFDLRVELTQVEVNVRLDPDTFHPRIPPGQDPITIDELRDGGPLAGRTPTSHD